MIFADTDQTVALTLWGAVTTIGMGVIGIVTLVMRQRHAIEVKRLERQRELREELARQKAQEAQDRNAEIASMKKAGNEIYQRWKELATTFKEEKDLLQKQYEQKCAEVIELKIHLEEAKKRLGESDD